MVNTEDNLESLLTYNVFISSWFLAGVDITEDNLEDLLTYDDLFLDYFNAFLALPVSNSPSTCLTYVVFHQENIGQTN